MGTIGIYDADYMNYENVIPSLECAKLCTYFHNKKEIATLSSILAPERYSEFYIQKNYDDGYYPKKIFLPSCIYGGRAFTPKQYYPLPEEIERTIPNMHIYDKYIDKYGPTPTERAQIKRILSCAHIRLSTDEEKPKTLAQLKRILSTGKYNGIIFHDYDLGKVKGAYDVIYELSNTRNYITKKGINPYQIGNKFPIQVNSSEELQKWLKVNAMTNIFFLQYNGLMSNEVLINLCNENKKMARQIYYNITDGCSSENDFLINRASKIFKQVLFLRRQNIKILLIYDEKIIITPQVKNFIELINSFLSFSWQDNFMPLQQTLYRFCRSYRNKKDKVWAFKHVQLTVQEMREVFQYIRENNYDLFKMFYEWESVHLEKGEFVND